MEHLLTIVIFLPLLGGLVLLLGRRNETFVKAGGILVSLLTFAISLGLFFGYNPDNPAMQYVDKVLWITDLNIGYHVGIDGISMLLIVLTTFLTPIVLLSSWDSIKKQVPMYVFLMLLLETGMLGVFSSLDTFLFYVFWEIILIPMYFIIGIWGGKERIYASIKFFLYTMAGSLLMLIAIIWLGWYASTLPGGQFTTDITKLFEIAPGVPFEMQVWLFAAFALSFLIKVPAFPVHTWLPDAHVQAPTGGSVILAGVLLKMGTYGLIRFNLQLFPSVAIEYAGFLAAIGVIGIIYGALVSMVQKDVKKLVAYSSVSHMGFILLGLFGMTTEGLQGGLIQMINHGLSTGALFLIVGMIYDRRHTRMIEDFGGLAKSIPIFATMFMIVTLSSIGLPGMNGFVGEFLILLGSFKSGVLGSPWYVIIAASGVVLAAVYMLWMFQRVVFGTIKHEENAKLKDLNSREIGLLLPIIILIFWIGLYPSTFLSKSEKSIQRVVNVLEEAHAQHGNGEDITSAE
ncbi:MAG: NADH-quinone oxidoreductase subunit M [Ectothiorhodospiraceae bacterium]|nr:NADH-quinone oxidoreductase subunit M [Ectothiorhodospiraceae bacterium]